MLPRTDRIISQVADAIRVKWKSMILATKPSWWGRMAMFSGSGGGGGLTINRIPGGLGFRISYANKGKYNYFRVIEYGRPRFDMKPGLLASPRARMGKNGRYIIIAFSKNQDGSTVSPENNDFNSIITKIGTKKEPNADGKRVTRNRYSYRQDPGTTGKGNAFISEQQQKDGSVHRSYMKFVVLSENSGGWYYPAIPPYQTKKRIKKEIGKTLSNPKTKKAINQAIASDLQPTITDFLKRNLKK